MAEFCVDCWNEINETKDPSEKFVLSREKELCEGCGELKRTITAIRRTWWIRKLLFRDSAKGTKRNDP